MRVAKATPALVKAEGHFSRQQFEAATEEDLEDIIDERIAEAESELKQQVGAAYDSADPTISRLLTTAETYLATAKMYNTMLNIIAAWDAEVLPSEFVQAEVAERQRDWYLRAYEALVGPFDEQMDRVARPYFRAEGISLEGENPV